MKLNKIHILAYCILYMKILHIQPPKVLGYMSPRLTYMENPAPIKRSAWTKFSTKRPETRDRSVAYTSWSYQSHWFCSNNFRWLSGLAWGSASLLILALAFLAFQLRALGGSRGKAKSLESHDALRTKCKEMCNKGWMKQLNNSDVFFKQLLIWLPGLANQTAPSSTWIMESATVGALLFKKRARHLPSRNLRLSFLLCLTTILRYLKSQVSSSPWWSSKPEKRREKPETHGADLLWGPRVELWHLGQAHQKLVHLQLISVVSLKTLRFS